MHEKYTNNYKRNLIKYWQQFYPNWTIPKGFHVHHIFPDSLAKQAGWPGSKIHHPRNLIALHIDDHYTIHKCRGDHLVSKPFIMSFKGRIPWNKGLKTGPRSEETKQKIRKGNLGNIPSAESRRKNSERHKGRPPANKGQPSPRKGMPGRKWAEAEKLAHSLRCKGGIPHNKGSTNAELYGKEKAEKLQKINKTKDAIPVVIDNIKYYSIIEASRQLKITERKVKILAGLL